MLDLCREAGLAEPEHGSRPEWFRVTFHKSRAVGTPVDELGLNERQRKAVESAQTTGRITRQEYVLTAHTTDRTALHDLKDLVEKRLLTRVSRGNQTHYVMAAEFTK